VKRTLTISVLLLFLGGCAAEYLYLSSGAAKFKAKAHSKVITYTHDTNFWGFSDTSQEEANQRALEDCKAWRGKQGIVSKPEYCLLAYEGNIRVWEESLEKDKQKVFERALLSSVKRCIAYGFEGRLEIASCVQKEMNPSVSVVTDSTNNQEISSRLQSIEIQNAITQGMLWYEATKPQTRR